MRLRSRLLTLSYLLLAYCVRGTQGTPLRRPMLHPSGPSHSPQERLPESGQAQATCMP